MNAVLAFELANRAYFARFVSDRGDDFYERYAEHHRDLLIEQDSGACIFHVLIDRDGAVCGRFNLYDVADGSASQRVLENAGFSAAEDCVVAGQPGIRYRVRLTASP